MDRLTALRLFLRVADAQAPRGATISAAGRALGLSTTAASKAIQDLEASLGLRLLDRTTRHVTPTEAGRHLRARLAPLLGELDTALDDAAAMHDQPRGLLRVLARRSFAVMQVVPALPGFRAAHPGIDVDLVLTETPDLTPTNGVDMAIRLGPPAGKPFVAVELAVGRHVLCSSPGWLARHGDPATLEAIGAADCLRYRLERAPTAWVFDLRGGPREVEVRGPLAANSGLALRQAVLDGLGVTLLPDWMVGLDVAAGRLVACGPPFPSWPAGYRASIYAVHARAALVPAKITAFLAHLRAVLPFGRA